MSRLISTRLRDWRRRAGSGTSDASIQARGAGVTWSLANVISWGPAYRRRRLQDPEGVFCGPSPGFTNVANQCADSAQAGIPPEPPRGRRFCGHVIGQDASLGAGAVVTAD